jgi:hypothetical protein
LEAGVAAGLRTLCSVWAKDMPAVNKKSSATFIREMICAFIV